MSLVRMVRPHGCAAMVATGLCLWAVLPAAAAGSTAGTAFGGLPAFPVPQGPAAPSATPPGVITLPSPMTATDPTDPSKSLEKPASPHGDLAFGAFQRGYFATALSEAMKRVQKNPKDGAAMALIGEIYAQGLAVRTNPTEAARWDRLASLQGNREGTFSYAMALLGGNGVTKDRAAAKALFEKAAAQGHAGALYNLGVMALEGDGHTRDFGLAASYFRQAVEAGDVDALFALATLYQGGRGVATDLGKAAALMKRAADQKHVGAEVEYGIMLFNGKGVDKDEHAAAHYFSLAANQNNPVAQNRLARLYAAGRGVDKDLVEAAHWHILARAAGVSDSWLDEQMAQLSPAEKAKVEEVVRRQVAP